MELTSYHEKNLSALQYALHVKRFVSLICRYRRFYGCFTARKSLSSQTHFSSSSKRRIINSLFCIYIITRQLLLLLSLESNLFLGAQVLSYFYHKFHNTELYLSLVNKLMHHFVCNYSCSHCNGQ